MQNRKYAKITRNPWIVEKFWITETRRAASTPFGRGAEFLNTNLWRSTATWKPQEEDGQRGDFGNAQNYFDKTWKDYKDGFGNLKREFWL
ncbi:hypothetical protein TNCT_349331, partial [Trichonephila clavata]